MVPRLGCCTHCLCVINAFNECPLVFAMPYGAAVWMLHTPPVCDQCIQLIPSGYCNAIWCHSLDAAHTACVWLMHSINSLWLLQCHMVPQFGCCTHCLCVIMHEWIVSPWLLQGHVVPRLGWCTLPVCDQCVSLIPSGYFKALWCHGLDAAHTASVWSCMSESYPPGYFKATWCHGLAGVRCLCVINAFH